jgi:hypothetical protein
VTYGLSTSYRRRRGKTRRIYFTNRAECGEIEEQMIELLIVGGLLLLPVLLIVVNVIVTAPKGYEDEKGFHYGE